MKVSDVIVASMAAIATVAAWVSIVPATINADILGPLLGLPTAQGTILQRRPAEGEQCLVCDQRVFDGDVVQVRYKGRTFHMAAGGMAELFAKAPDQYFRKLQARSALFDESSTGGRPISHVWLIMGLYGLLSLIVAAACGYLAITKGLAPGRWFFAGLIGSGIVLAILLARPSCRGLDSPAGVPPGLRKVPSTYTPATCPRCGAENHPSGSVCTGCGADLSPSVQPETSRA